MLQRRLLCVRFDYHLVAIFAQMQGFPKAWGCRWAATLGIILAASRGLIVEAGTAFEPELALLETVAHTHYLPRHWRGRAHTREVQTQFQQLFQYKAGPSCFAPKELHLRSGTLSWCIQTS